MLTRTTVTFPKPLTSLIGRENELVDVQQFLLAGHRLVTLTGIGGIGKTRLAQQIALEMEPAYATIALVPLANVREAHAIPNEIARALGQPEPATSVEAIAHLFGGGPFLLVLDNLEQIPAATETIAALLHHVPSLSMLITSQVPLLIAGEQRFPLEPMATDAGVALFRERASVANPYVGLEDDDAATIAAICTLLDGIPLAIELAAARTNILSVTDLRVQLQTRLRVLSTTRNIGPDRHRTMRRAIGWSIDLLNPDEQRLFRYLSVFAGAISLDAVAHTLASLEQTLAPLDAVEILTTRGLLRSVASSGGPRYTMLPTLREYGREQLLAAGDEFSANLSLASWAVELATRYTTTASTPQDVRYAMLTSDLDTIGAATAWAATYRPEHALRIIDALHPLLDARGVSPRYLELGALALAGDAPPAIRARGHLALGILELRYMNDFAAAAALLSGGLPLARECEDTETLHALLSNLGTASYLQYNYETAETYFRQAEALAEATNYARGKVDSAVNWANMTYVRKHYADAIALLADIMPAIRELGDLNLLARSLRNLGMFQLTVGDLTEAGHHLGESLEIWRRLQDVSGARATLTTLAYTSMELGDLDASLAYFDESLDLTRRYGAPLALLEILAGSTELLMLRGDYAAAANRIAEALTLPRSPSDDAAMCLLYCAAVSMTIARRSGQRQQAAALLGAVDAHWPQYPHMTADSAVAERMEFRAELAHDTCDAAWLAYQGGLTWSLERMVAAAHRAAADYLEQPAAQSVSAAGEPTRGANLTVREREVLAAMMRGLTNAEIADEMYISPRTISTHVTNILAKLDVRNRAAAVALALQEGLV